MPTEHAGGGLVVLHLCPRLSLSGTVARWQVVWSLFLVALEVLLRAVLLRQIIRRAWDFRVLGRECLWNRKLDMPVAL